MRDSRVCVSFGLVARHLRFSESRVQGLAVSGLVGLGIGGLMVRSIWGPLNPKP